MDTGSVNNASTPDPRAAMWAAFAAVALGPLFAFRGAFGTDFAATPEHVVGLMSALFWSLVIVGSGLYLVLALRADNAGEGGTMALIALVRRAAPRAPLWRNTVIVLGLAAAACAIAATAVLPALAMRAVADGARLADADMHGRVTAIAIALVLLLLTLQRAARPRLERVLAGLAGLWLATSAALGGAAIALAPEVLAALDPRAALRFVASSGPDGLASLAYAAVALGGLEIVYAAQGVIPARRLQRLWFVVVLPLVLLADFGQAAHLLAIPGDGEAPSFGLVPRAWLWPMLLLTAAAALHASRNALLATALMLREAIPLGYLPRMRFARSAGEGGRHAHLPGLMVPLFLAQLVLLVSTHRASALAAAYAFPVAAGVVATGTMVLLVARWHWHRSAVAVAAFGVPLGLVSLVLVAGSAAALEQGAWVAPLIAAVALLLMTTWHGGRERLLHRTTSDTLPLESFIESIRTHPPRRIDQPAIVLTGRPDFVPQVLLNNLRFNHVLFARVIVLTVETTEEPHVADSDRLELDELGEGFHRGTLRFGFAEETNVPLALARVAPPHLERAIATGVYLIGHEVVVSTSRKRLRSWRDTLFAAMVRNALPANAYFHVPTNRLIEIGTQWQA